MGICSILERFMSLGDLKLHLDNHLGECNDDDTSDPVSYFPYILQWLEHMSANLSRLFSDYGRVSWDDIIFAYTNR